MPVPVRVAAELPTTAVHAPGEFVSGEALAEIASTYEEHGFDACHVTDHPAGDVNWLEHGGHHALDPFVALSVAGSATTRLRLLTYIVVAAYRNPFLTAKSALTVDVLCGGRFILGLGAGYLKAEFRALGVDFDERNELLEEAVDVMKLAWTSDSAAYEGRHFNARGVRMLPRPIAQPHPPIWIGGNSYRAIRTAVERAQGWAPFPSAGIAQTARTADIGGLAELAPRIEWARNYAKEVGRTEPLDVCFGGPHALQFDGKRSQDQLQQLADAGVTWVTVGFRGATRREYLDDARRYADEVLSPLR
jgi:probable F420-dependent oxidoreductase